MDRGNVFQCSERLVFNRGTYTVYITCVLDRRYYIKHDAAEEQRISYDIYFALFIALLLFVLLEPLMRQNLMTHLVFHLSVHFLMPQT